MKLPSLEIFKSLTKIKFVVDTLSTDQRIDKPEDVKSFLSEKQQTIWAYLLDPINTPSLNHVEISFKQMNTDFAAEILHQVLLMTNERKESIQDPTENQQSEKMEEQLGMNTKEIIINLRCFNMDFVTIQAITDLINNMNEVILSQDRKIKFQFKCCIQEEPDQTQHTFGDVMDRLQVMKSNMSDEEKKQIL